MNRHLQNILRALCVLLFLVGQIGLFAQCEVEDPGTIGDSRTICAGDSPGLLGLGGTSATSTNGTSFEYLWMKSTSTSGGNLTWVSTGATGETFDPGTLTETTYFTRCVRLTTGTCGTGTYYETPNIIVTVLAKPTAQIKTAPSSIEVGSDASFEATAVDALGGTVEYSWSIPGASPATSMDQNPTFSFPSGTFAPGDNVTITLTVSRTIGGVTCTNIVIIVIQIVAPLPVEMSWFRGEALAHGVELNWETASELNNDVFLVERATDGRNFEIIGEVLGNGTTETASNYTYVDENAAPGTNYYRLLQLDYDGSETTSNVITVNRQSDNGGIVVAPNPVQEELTIRTPATDRATNWQVFNLVSGQPVLQFRQTEGSSQTRIATGHLSAGNYVARATDGTTFRFTKL